MPSLGFKPVNARDRVFVKKCALTDCATQQLPESYNITTTQDKHLLLLQHRYGSSTWQGRIKLTKTAAVS